MARNKGWTWIVIISVLIGMAGASIFWLYSPYGHNQLAQQVAEDLEAQRALAKLPGSSLKPQKMASQTLGFRFQLVTDGKQVFLVDMKNGRVWRYFHEAKTEGSGKADEGFLPLGMYYGGRKHYSAAEIEAPVPSPGGSPQAPSGRGQP
jgi:hypothetical protein